MTAVLGLLRAVPLRWWLYLGAAAAFAFVLWREDRATHQRDEARAENRELRAELDAANETAQRRERHSNAYQKRLRSLGIARGTTPTRAVRLCVAAPARVPAPVAGHAAAGPSELPDPPGRDLEVGRDIGVELYALADEADQCAAQRDALIEWFTDGG